MPAFELHGHVHISSSGLSQACLGSEGWPNGAHFVLRLVPKASAPGVAGCREAR